MTQTQKPVAIIGYGTGGVNAIIGLRNAGYEGRILVFSDTNIPPYSPILTSYYAGGEKTYEECFPWSAEELADFDIEVLAGAPVEEIDVDAHTIRTAQGTYEYAKCVIATGSRPMRYGFPKVEGYEPIVLRTMDDAERLKTAIEDPACKRILVSGASMVALKSLEACVNRGTDITLVGMKPHVLDMNALPEAAARFEKGLEKLGVNLKLGTVIADVKMVEAPEALFGRELEVTFANGDTGVFDEITVAHGMKSNLEFIPEGALELDRALVVDEFMRTSNPDVYAAGDVVQATELISGQKRIVGIWKNAALQGACAGAAIAAEMAGEEAPAACALKGSIATNTILVKDLLFISAGTIELNDERRVEIRENDDMIVIYIYEDNRLVGFNLTCDNVEAQSDAYDIGAMLTMHIEAGCR